MKKIISIILILTICLSSICLISADNNKFKSLAIKGLQYDNLPFATSEMGDGLNSKLIIKNVAVDSNTINLDGFIIEADGNMNPLFLKGKIYHPVIHGFSTDRAVILVTENNSKYDTIHFSIEKNSNKEMLLRKDRKNFSNKPVIKLYLQEHDTRKVHFFEDTIDNKLVNVEKILTNRLTIKETRGKSSEELKKFTANELELEKSIILADLWFGKLFDNSKQHNNADKVQSFVPGEDGGGSSTPNFKSIGQQCYYTSTIGWFKDSFEWPAASGNIMSYYMKYDFVTHTPETGSATLAV